MEHALGVSAGLLADLLVSVEQSVCLVCDLESELEFDLLFLSQTINLYILSSEVGGPALYTMLDLIFIGDVREVGSHNLNRSPRTLIVIIVVPAAKECSHLLSKCRSRRQCLHKVLVRHRHGEDAV